MLIDIRCSSEDFPCHSILCQDHRGREMRRRNERGTPPASAASSPSPPPPRATPLITSDFAAAKSHNNPSHSGKDAQDALPFGLRGCVNLPDVSSEPRATVGGPFPRVAYARAHASERPGAAPKWHHFFLCAHSALARPPAPGQLHPSSPPTVT